MSSAIAAKQVLYRQEAPVASAAESDPAAPAIDLIDQLIVGASLHSDRLRSAHALQLLRPLIRAAETSAQAKIQLIDVLGRSIQRIDRMVSRQLNQILHHARFQKLESSWRGLRYLVDQSQEAAAVQIRMLNVSWEELARDAEQALDFDQSVLFQKVYEEEFGVAGGEPFGVLIGDYEIRHRLTPDHGIDDVGALTAVAQTAAASFAPFIAGAHPSLLGLNSFADLERPTDFQARLELPEYIRWNAFRESEDARFVGLTAPRMLMRLPYDDDNADQGIPFAFIEDLDAPNAANYLWGNAAWAFGGVLMRAFAETHWLSEIRGARRIAKGGGAEGGGLVAGLPIHCFATDADGVAPKFSTDVVVSDDLERTLTDLGLISLCRCKDTEFSAFHGNPSLQRPRVYADSAATENARLSSMLQQIFCAARVGHYLKVMGRDWLGTFIEPAELQHRLSEWLSKLRLDDDNATAQKKAEYPLRNAEVSVTEEAGKAGSYVCRMMLMPHSQTDQVAVGINLVTRLSGARSAASAASA